MMIELVITPGAAGLRVTLGILDGRVAAVEFPREIAPARRLRARTIGELLWLEDPLQLLEHDRSLREFAGLLEDLVGSRFDVDVVVFGEPFLVVVQSIRSQRRPDVAPRAPDFLQDEL